MYKSKDSSTTLTDWGTSLLNKLPSITRNRRKRDASKRRRKNSKKEIKQDLDES